MKKILIVDDNAETRKALFAQLNVHNKFRVFSLDNAKIAAKFIRTQRIDLVITELNLPEINGFKLLYYIKKYSPDTHRIAITDVFSPQIIKKLKSMGVFTRLNKPVKINSLIDIISEQFDHPSGRIHGVTLSSFLQLLNLEKKTCTLTLSVNKNQGVIHCVEGEIIGAQTGEYTGKAAFYKIMEWDDPAIMIREGCPNTQRQIDVPLMHLLMESHQAMDERTSDESEPDDFGIISYATDPGTQSNDAKKCNDRPLDLNYMKLASELSENPEILRFEILNDKGLVLNETSLFNHNFKVSPLAYFLLGNAIGPLVGGSLKYSTITRSNHSNYLIGKSNQYFIRAKIKPGGNVGDIIR